MTPLRPLYSWETLPSSLLSLLLRGYWERSRLKSQGFSTYPIYRSFSAPWYCFRNAKWGQAHVNRAAGEGVWNRTFYFAKFSLWRCRVKGTDRLLLSRGFPFPERIPKSNLPGGGGKSAAQHSDDLLLLIIPQPRLLPAALRSGCHGRTLLTHPDYPEPCREIYLRQLMGKVFVTGLLV